MCPPTTDHVGCALANARAGPNCPEKEASGTFCVIEQYQERAGADALDDRGLMRHVPGRSTSRNCSLDETPFFFSVALLERPHVSAQSPWAPERPGPSGLVRMGAKL